MTPMTPEWVKEHMARYNRTMGITEPDDDTPDEGPERVLQQKIVKYCDDHGYPCQSNRQTQRAKTLLTPGWPDVTIMAPGGKTVYLELKSAKGRLKKDQVNLRLQAMALGHEIHLAKSYKRFVAIMEERV